MMTSGRTDSIEFEREVMPFKGALYGYALKLTRNPDDARDLLQETFLKAFRFFNTFREGSNAKAWLHMIMKNSFINQYKKHQRLPGMVDYEDVENFYESIKPEEVRNSQTEEDLFCGTFGDEIAGALRVLPGKFLEVLVLSDIEGSSYKEIAQRINCPVGTVRSRLHRARRIMQTRLENYARNLGYMKGGCTA